jgi:uncharacterized protein (DUF2126 family)/transglutaminase-like putative cysteine protease
LLVVEGSHSPSDVPTPKDNAMAIHVALQHLTHYRYDRPVQLGPQIVRLRPAPHSRTRVLSYSQTVGPSEHFINWQQDPFANYQARLTLPKPTREFSITVDLVVEMAVYNPFDFFLEPQAEHFPLSYSASERTALAPYLATSHLGPRLYAYLKTVDQRRRRMVDFLVDVNQAMHAHIGYTIRMEPGVQTPEDTLGLRSGSCRDSAWLLVNLLRHLGLAARFVSGYLIQLKADVAAVDGPNGPDKDFTDLHAWCEVYLPGAGWVGLDPTSGLMAGEGHIPLACTPQPASAAPVEGAVEKSEVSFEHHMSVQRVFESPRVTQPYSDEQWAGILALGEAVDQDLQRQDVRLTMGGEPTFVATGDRDAPEWNTDALGPTKRGYATELMGRLRQAYGQGGFVHMGQGKWYPGEQLPRWALSICWRSDGEPCWHEPALLADERDAAQHTTADALRFAQTLSRTLGVGEQHITAAHEDTWYYLWRERRLPVNVDPFDSRLDDELERARLRRVFDQGLDATVGYVLPLSVDERGWHSGPWWLRDERLYLIPGDSPMGYRLPLDALPWVASNDFPYHLEQDPYAPRDLLPTQRRVACSAHGPAAARNEAEISAPAKGQSAVGLTRTAVCVEVRDPQRANGPQAEHSHGGQSRHLYVFMPPLSRLEDYLNLVAAVEATAQALNLPVVMEGYGPPRDPRLKVLQITPDPGVIEVNIHPAYHWSELVEHTEHLYEAAHQTRLCAEKFMLDGRHTGTGGGNHLVMGGATPEDSPFLRRPELLASLIAYWHNHPSLSYLFSGLFIGPTSQAPRVDEARNDQLVELEIALAAIERNREEHGQAMPPWLVDRALRNILIDVTGNTHRSEFCIDKLYSPDSSTGRLGLLELRAFEMPPHARMSVAQQLLLRALVAKFWQNPWQGRLSRWGTELHDRWLLPTFIRMDFADVLADLADSGYAFDPEWFEPHIEFRFPFIGQIEHRGMVLALRTALEPWHVMGEEGSAGGTVRYVDASLERVEIKVSGFNPARYVVTCNGHSVPLQSTGTVGEFVAGIRFKAWAPPSALHPSIAPHAPLTFDLIDTWNQRSMGGCQYHVSHPGGLNHERLPINAFEAESRRLTRFIRMGHTPGRWQAVPATAHPESPFTLDLRRAGHTTQP